MATTRARRRYNTSSPNMSAKQGRLRPPPGRSRVGVAGVGVGTLPNPAKPVPKPAVTPRALAPPVAAAPAAGPPPQTSDSQTIRANAQAALGTAQTGYRDSAFRAAMALGDPAAWAKMSVDPQFAGYTFTQDPNSLFAQLARDETEGLQGLDEEANSRNAFLSGFRLDDRNKFSTGIGEQRAGGSRDFDSQLAEFARILAGAQGDYRTQLGDADRIDREAAEAVQPEPAAAPVPYGPGDPNWQQAFQTQISGYNAREAAKARARRKKK